MKRKALFAAAALFFGVTIVLTFALIVKADYTQWDNDVYISSPTWNNWPTTLAVILAEFPDVTHERYAKSPGDTVNFLKVYTWQNFYDMLASDTVYFSPGHVSPDSEAVFGSLRDYFGNMSNETYRPTIEILNDKTSGNPNLPPQWFMLPHTKTYYDGLGLGSFGALTNDAMALAQSAGKDVTRNSNRRICVIYAGNRRTNINGAAYLGGDRYLMFERWKFAEPLRYTVEYQDAPFTHMGAHVHEFAHVRGFHHATTNRWGPLGDGQKNGPSGSSFGACPAPIEPWFRSLDGWVTLTPITGDSDDADLVYDGVPNNYIINLTRSSDGQAESFLIENRQFTSGYDRWLPGANGGTGGPGGLLIWNIKGSNPEVANAVDLSEADNDPANDPTSLPYDIFRPDGAYPYQKIFDYSSPAKLKFRDGSLSHFAVDNYTANGDVITVDFKTGYLSSNSAEATAMNGSRKLVRDTGGAYHLVYETEGEIYYQKSTNGGNSWSGFRRLSSGTGSNKYPCLAERSGSLFAVWQRYTGSTHVVYHRRYASGAWGSTQTLDSNAGANAPLPVIASPAANELMVVYRSGGNLKWRRSTDNGSSWSTAATISGTALNSPTVAPAKTAWGANTTALAYATNVIPNASNILLHYYNSGWSAA